ncbi:MAG: GNAT family N-acetyltransferase [Sporolactobacillus sp.]
MTIGLETPRLRLREWTIADLPPLKRFLQDEQVMTAYAHAFSDEEVRHWLDWTLRLYRERGYGLWAIERKADGEVVGECGLTDQTVDGVVYLEIGYHLIRAYWHHGYAGEAARTCKLYAFEHLKRATVVSIVRDTSLASMNVAIRHGMTVRKRFVKHYWGQDMPHYLFAADSDKITYQQ